MAFAWGRWIDRPSAGRCALASAVSLAVPAVFLAYVNTSAEYPRGAIAEVYPRFDDYRNGWLKFEALSPPRGTRVAYAGTNLPYFLMAGGLRNEVFYVNIDAHPDWLLHDYHLSAADRHDPPVWDTPRPGWDRIHPDYPAWLDNLRRREIQLLVVARANPRDGGFNPYDSDQFPIERYWAEFHPEDFERVYPIEKNDPQFWIYRVKPRAGGDSAKSATDLRAGSH